MEGLWSDSSWVEFGWMEGFHILTDSERWADCGWYENGWMEGVECQEVPDIVMPPPPRRGGRGFKSISETFTVITPDNYHEDEEEILLMLALLA